MRALLLLAVLLAAACDCPTERVSSLRGVAGVEGNVTAGLEAAALNQPQVSCSPTERICWFPAGVCDVRGLQAIVPAEGALPTWLGVDCHAAGGLALPLPDLRTAEGTIPLDVPLERGPLAGFRPSLATSVGRAQGFPADPACPAAEWPAGTHFVGELELLERTGGPAGPDVLVTPDFRVRAELRGEIVPGPGPACAVPPLGLVSLRFGQTPYEYATVGDRCE